MGILDVFKRKKEEWPEVGAPAKGGYGPGFIGAPELPGTTPPITPSESILPGMPPPTSAAPAPLAAARSGAMKQEIEALTYKVDALKSTLDVINSRLANIEEALRGKRGSVY